MKTLLSNDGRYLVVEQDTDQNLVVYEQATMRPVWDRFSHERLGGRIQEPHPPFVPPAVHVPKPPPSTLRPIQVTSAADGVVVNRIYSYYANAFKDADGTIFIFAGTTDGPRFHLIRPGEGASAWRPMMPYGGETENWYWTRDGRICLPVGPRLLSVDPFTGDERVLIDISQSHPGCDLWQAHSSDDGLTHSATVRRIVSEGPYPKLGTIISRSDGVTWGYLYSMYAAIQPLDESQISPDGKFVVIKEGDDNRIIEVATGQERWIRDTAGAVGHSDIGWPAILVGEDNITGVCVLYDLDKKNYGGGGTDLFDTWNLGHLAIRGDLCIRSDATNISRVNLQTGEQTILLAHGMVPPAGPHDPYDFQCRANLSPDGSVLCWMSNNGTDRFDVFVAEL